MTYSGSALRLHRRGMLVPLVTVLLGAAPAQAQDPYQQLGIQPPSPPGYPTIAPPPQPAIDDHSYSSQNVRGGVQLVVKLPEAWPRFLRGGVMPNKVDELSNLLRFSADSSRILKRLFNALTPEARTLVLNRISLTREERDDLADAFNLAMMGVDLTTGDKRHVAGAIDQFLKNIEDPTLKDYFVESSDEPPSKTQAYVIRAAKANTPLTSIIILGGELLGSGSPVASAPQLTYSSNLLSADISLKPYLGRRLGYGVSASFEATRSAIAAEQIRLRETYQKGVAAFERRDAGIDRLAVPFLNHVRAYTSNHNQFVVNPRLNLQAGYVHIGHLSDRLAGGATLGVLEPLGPEQRLDNPTKRQKAGFGALTVQGVNLDRNDGRGDSGARLAVRVGVQDAVPYIYDNGTKVHRWKWQVGLEYAPVDVGPNSHPVALFLRHRFGGEAAGLAPLEVLDRTTEVGFSVGRSSGGDVFFSLRVSRFFGW